MQNNLYIYIIIIIVIRGKISFAEDIYAEKYVVSLSWNCILGAIKMQNTLWDFSASCALNYSNLCLTSCERLVGMSRQIIDHLGIIILQRKNG